jgi:hypothetical protein
LSQAFERDWLISLQDFAQVVWPALQTHCPPLRCGELRLVEREPKHALSRDLDAVAGIDAYQRTTLALRGIAFRVQWGENHRTFTVRESRPNGSTTEYRKRLFAIRYREQGYLYPFWSIHAYLDKPGGNLLAVAVAKTSELYLYVERQERQGPPLPRSQAGKGREGFLIVDWQQYRRANNYLFVYPTGTDH